MLEAPTGTSTTETAQNSDLNNLYSLTYDGNTQHVINWWNGLYRVIAQANLVLEKVPGITPMDEAQKKKNFRRSPLSSCLGLFLCSQVMGRRTNDHKASNCHFRGFQSYT